MSFISYSNRCRRVFPHFRVILNFPRILYAINHYVVSESEIVPRLVLGYADIQHPRRVETMLLRNWYPYIPKMRHNSLDQLQFPVTHYVRRTPLMVLSKDKVHILPSLILHHLQNPSFLPVSMSLIETFNDIDHKLIRVTDIYHKIGIFYHPSIYPFIHLLHCWVAGSTEMYPGQQPPILIGSWFMHYFSNWL